jgi:metal-responsive CopG/Arc/MetJ family transcriptional regulator
MKTAISLPDAVFTEAEALAEELGWSRSELYTKALQAYLHQHSREQILTKLNQVYGEAAAAIDPQLARMQFISLSREDW